MVAPKKAGKSQRVFEQDAQDQGQYSLSIPSEEEEEEEEDEDEEDDQEDVYEEEEEDSDLAQDSKRGAKQDKEVQGPGFAQYVDEDELDEQEYSEDDSEESEEEEEEEDYDNDKEARRNEKSLQQQMKNIPFSALLKAKAQIDDDSDASFSDSEMGISDLEPDEFEEDRKRLAAKNGKKPLSHPVNDDEELETKRRQVRERLKQLKDGNDPQSDSVDEGLKRRRERERIEIEKRANKHAPTEVSSKRPVSRKRAVVEVTKSNVRDPRFESLSGSVNSDLFSKSYSFLPEMYTDELSTLRTTLNKLKKQEASQAGPKAKSEQAVNIREERQKVEMALRRAEGLASERGRRHRETDFKRRIKKDNKERVEKGMSPFYLKKSEKKALLLKEKYDRLSGTTQDGEGSKVSGGERQALKKALERRRKKNAQKEKRDMPVGLSFGGNGGAVPKRKKGDESASTPKVETRHKTDGGAPKRKRAKRGDRD